MPQAKHIARLSLCLLLLAMTLPAYARGSATPGESAVAVGEPAGTAEQDARMAWFREARFGMFIHFGLYSTAAGQWEGQPVGFVEYFGFRDPEDWAKLLDEFNPVDFDADAIVRAAKAAGMQYLVITAKHHDGFCLFDSAHTEFDVMSTPFGRDIIREMSEACRRHGLRFGLYYSIIDLHHADYLPRHAFDPRPADGADFERYVAFMKDQLRELLTSYGPIDVVWFDGEWENTWTHGRALDLWDFVRELQPDALINNRIDKGRAGMQGMNTGDHYLGDFGTPEQELLERNPGEDWETCQTMNRHGNWGWRSDEGDYYSEPELIQQVIACASMGGNMLLNIGPKDDGTIAEPQQARLDAIGRWMNSHGEAIYASQASPYARAPAWGRCTLQGETLYCHVFEMPEDGKLVLPVIEGEVAVAWAHADGERAALPVVRLGDGALQVDASSVDVEPGATVIAVRFETVPVAPPYIVRPDRAGVLTFDASEAEIHGSARYDPQHDSIGYWTDAGTTIVWPVLVPAPGRYRVEVTYGCADDGGGTYRVEVAGAHAEADSRKTGGWFDRATDTIGELQIMEAGAYDLRVLVVDMPGLAVFDFQRVVLRPITD
ncbi:alpha-L-fucosidase [Phycisphaeraceae bacterium D3-23]